MNKRVWTFFVSFSWTNGHDFGFGNIYLDISQSVPDVETIKGMSSVIAERTGYRGVVVLFFCKAER
jgi:hypothetical protein